MIVVELALLLETGMVVMTLEVYTAVVVAAKTGVVGVDLMGDLILAFVENS